MTEDTEGTPTQRMPTKRKVPRLMAVSEPTSTNSKLVECHYWPNCRNGSQCPFYHPSPYDSANNTICHNFPSCVYGDQCRFVHPRPECKFGLKCKKLNCEFNHSHAGVPCKFGNSCRRADCGFAHDAPDESQVIRRLSESVRVWNPL